MLDFLLKFYFFWREIIFDLERVKDLIVYPFFFRILVREIF